FGTRGRLGDGNVMGFSSLPALRPSGLPHYPFRAYSPDLARFLSQDPIGELGGINLYDSFLNSPVNGVDPLGLEIYPKGYTGPIQLGDSVLGDGLIFTLMDNGLMQASVLETGAN